MRLSITLLAAVSLLPSLAGADAVTEAIRKGGVALPIRHATAPGTFDPENFRLDDCSTQRNLSNAGRDQARRIGKIKPGDKPLVLVTHLVMVTALTGIYPQSGEVVVVAPVRESGNTGLKMIGSIKAETAR